MSLHKRILIHKLRKFLPFSATIEKNLSRDISPLMENCDRIFYIRELIDIFCSEHINAEALHENNSQSNI